MSSFSLMRGLDPRIQSYTQRSTFFALDRQVEPGDEGLLNRSVHLLNRNRSFGDLPQVTEKSPIFWFREIPNLCAKPLNLNRKAKP